MTDLNQTPDSDTNTDQKNEVDIENMTAEELDAFVKERKAEVIKLNSIIERKGSIVKDLNEKVTDVDTEKPIIKPVSDSEALERMELKVDYGYPDEVIEEVMKLGGKNALSNPITKKVADQMAKDIKTAQATDIPDGPNSSADRTIKVSDLDGLSSKEMEKLLPHKEI